MELAELITEVASAVVKISGVIEITSTGYAGTENVYGEKQVAMDVEAEDIMEAHLKTCPFVGGIGSEELDEMKIVKPDGQFSVFYDPLDGSSLVDVNLAVGTIVGIYEGTNIIGRMGREQVAAMFAVYGPRTTIMLSTGNGVHEFIFLGGTWHLKTENVKMGSDKKYFAPGNLRATTEREDYFDLVTWYMKEQYTLRYSGGMVPDINHILLKGQGIFMYPGMKSAPDGKLRYLFECAPMAFLLENAGGAASDGEMDILDIRVTGMEQRSPIYIGSNEEVKRCVEKLGR